MKEIIKELIKYNSYSLRLADKSLLSDKDIMKATVTYESTNRVARKRFNKLIEGLVL